MAEPKYVGMGFVAAPGHCENRFEGNSRRSTASWTKVVNGLMLKSKGEGAQNLKCVKLVKQHPATWLGVLFSGWEF